MNTFPLPPYVRLHELRRDAKRLLEAALDGDVPCLERFYEIGREPSLTAAQLVVAREHGFSSWAKLKHQVERNTADPRTEIVRQLKRRHDHTPDELPAILPYNQVIASAPDTKVVLNSVRVHRDSCRIELEAATRADLGTDSLRVTRVRFSDGRTFRESTDWIAAVMADPGAQVAEVLMGSSGISVWPLPPPGDLRFTIAWPRAGIPDGTEAVLDATRIHAAVRRIRPFTLGAAAGDAPPGSAGEPASTPDAPARWRRPRFLGYPPKERFSVVVPVGEIVARSSRLAIAVYAVRVYHPEWCALEIEWIAPRTMDARAPYRMALAYLFQRGRGPYISGRVLSPRYGVGFSDGRAVEYAAGGPRWAGVAPSEDQPLPELLLYGDRFGFTRGRHDCVQTGLLLAPLPPPGEVRFWFAWPDFGVPETTTILDGTAIHQAAQRIQRL